MQGLRPCEVLGRPAVEPLDETLIRTDERLRRRLTLCGEIMCAVRNVHSVQLLLVLFEEGNHIVLQEMGQ